MNLTLRLFVACCGWVPLGIVLLYAEQIPVPREPLTLVLSGVFALLGLATAWILFEDRVRGALPARRRRAVTSAD